MLGTVRIWSHFLPIFHLNVFAQLLTQLDFTVDGCTTRSSSDRGITWMQQYRDVLYVRHNKDTYSNHKMDQAAGQSSLLKIIKCNCSDKMSQIDLLMMNWIGLNCSWTKQSNYLFKCSEYHSWWGLIAFIQWMYLWKLHKTWMNASNGMFDNIVTFIQWMYLWKLHKNINDDDINASNGMFDYINLSIIIWW